MIRAKLGQKFVNEPELWKQTEEMTRNVLKNSGINYVEVPNEAAFYGPKIDVQVWSVIGREFTIATNQVDFAQPRRFDLRLQGSRQHRQDAALHSSRAARHTRTFHRIPDRALRRQFPALAVARAGAHLNYRRRSLSWSIIRELSWMNCARHQVRAEIDTRTDKINGKIQRAEQMKVHTMFVIGKRDMEANAVSVRVHGKGNLGAKPRGEVIADILQSIKERRSE